MAWIVIVIVVIIFFAIYTSSKKNNPKSKSPKVYGSDIKVFKLQMSQLVDRAIEILFLKESYINKTLKINELQNVIDKEPNEKEIKQTIIQETFKLLHAKYPNHKLLLDKELEYRLEFSDYINAAMVDDVIEEIDNQDIPQKKAAKTNTIVVDGITPEQASRIVEESTITGNYLGSQYSYYANIAGKPHEEQMLKELSELNPAFIYSWQEKQKAEGKYLTDNVFKRKNEIVDQYRIIWQNLYERQQAARDYELKEDFSKAIEIYSELSDNPACMPLVFERLTIIYRKQKDYDNEIKVCEKFISYFENTDPERCGQYKNRLLRAKYLKDKK